MIRTDIFSHQYIPARKPPSQEKLLVVLHGLGDSTLGYSWLPQHLALPDLSYLLINAPDSYYGGYSWYDFAGDQTPGVLRSREMMRGLLDELDKQGVASSRTALFGFSQGSLISLDTGLRTERLLAGICGVSGYLFFEEEYPAQLSTTARSQSFLLTHGTDDPVVPYEISRRQYEALKAMGLPFDFRTYAKEHTMISEELSEIRVWLKARLELE